MNSSHKRYLTIALIWGFAAFNAGCGASVHADSGQRHRQESGPSSKAVDAAGRFLQRTDIGQLVLGYVHFGASYKSHEYVETRDVTDSNGQALPGEFALVYRYSWEDDGLSDIAFLCDKRGQVESVRIVRTNASLSQPFLLANLSIQLLGNALIEAFRSKMDDDDQRKVQKLVDDADAQGLLVFSLRIQQAGG